MIYFTIYCHFDNLDCKKRASPIKGITNGYFFSVTGNLTNYYFHRYNAIIIADN